MYGASLTKQFIGVLMAQLVAEKKLDVEHFIREYLQELPTWADKIRIRHLLSHTSGLPISSVLTSQLGLPSGPDGERQWDNAMVVSALKAQSEPQRPPGTVYEYSNAGYICLAEIVQKVLQEPIADSAKGRLFEPLGMTDSYLGHGADDTPATIGDGGLWATVDDLMLWNEAMNKRHFGDPVHQLIETPWTLDDGTPLNYAWGLGVSERYGELTFSHGGGWPGRSGNMTRQPAKDLSIVLLTTCSEVESIVKTRDEILRSCSTDE
jgi:CubicO group peptidase (beta-lactamase class C family)